MIVPREVLEQYNTNQIDKRRDTEIYYTVSRRRVHRLKQTNKPNLDFNKFNLKKKRERTLKCILGGKVRKKY